MATRACTHCRATRGLPTRGNVCKACLSARAAARKAQYRQDLSDYKIAKGCADCGYNAHACALDFDHRPGTVKLFNISHCNQSLEALAAEIAKCDVVCANCHRVRTYQRGRLVEV